MGIHTSYASSITVEPSGQTHWVGVSNGLADDGNFIQVDPDEVAKYGTRDPLILTGFDFSTISDGTTISGVEVLVKAYGTESHQAIVHVELRYDGSTLGVPDVSEQNLSTSLSEHTFGHSGDDWGASLDTSIIKDPSFGCKVHFDDPSTSGIDETYVDVIYMKVYTPGDIYNEVGSGGVVVSPLSRFGIGGVKVGGSAIVEYNAFKVHMSGDLNGLENESNKLSDVIDNTVNLYLFEDLELYLTDNGTHSPISGGVVDIYLLASVDGTNFPDGDDAIDPGANAYVGSFVTRPVSTNQRMVVRRIPLPPLKYKYLLINKTGMDFNSTGNTLTGIAYTYSA